MVLQVFEKRKKWFSSYLTNREQFALIENCSYITKKILRGVLQSSTLGPFLYLIFYHFADDTNILQSISCCHIVHLQNCLFMSQIKQKEKLAPSFLELKYYGYNHNYQTRSVARKLLDIPHVKTDA